MSCRYIIKCKFCKKRYYLLRGIRIDSGNKLLRIGVHMGMGNEEWNSYGVECAVG